MSVPADSLSARLREARVGLEWKQKDLAARISVSQAAISQFERGNTKALSLAKVREAAQAVGLELDSTARDARDGQVLKYCENPDCLANVAYRSGGRNIVRPRHVLADPEQTTHCTECGGLLMDHCPDDDCQRPVEDGAFCAGCGTAYVPVADRDADRISELERVRAMTRVRA